VNLISEILSAAGDTPVSRLQPSLEQQSVCRTCGAQINPGRKYCRACNVASGTEQLMKAAPSGWVATQSPRPGFPRRNPKTQSGSQKGLGPGQPSGLAHGGSVPAKDSATSHGYFNIGNFNDPWRFMGLRGRHSKGPEASASAALGEAGGNGEVLQSGNKLLDCAALP
jgi:ribosomal protein L40E